MMDSNYIKMHLVVDRYLQGLLREDERSEFEERLIWDEQLMDELDLAERLREGLRESARQPAAGTASSGMFDRFSSLLHVPQYAAAASFVLAVTITSSLLLSVESTRDIGTGQTDIIPLISTRGENVQTIQINPQGWAVLLIDDPGSHDAYRITISAENAGYEPIWTSDGLTATYPEALAVALPGRLLDAGNYVATLESSVDDDLGNREHQQIQSIRFNVAGSN